MKICELLIWTWETEIMKHDMIWRITMQIEGCVICQGWTTSSSGKIRILQRYLVLLAHYTLQIAVAISHQVIVLLFLLCFFLYANHEDFYFIFSSSTKTAGLTQPCPQSSSITLVFSGDITNFFKINWSMVSWIWRISQEICAIRVGEIFWINSNKGVIPFLVRNSDFIIFVINLLEKHV